jgi:hypothetical protein
MTVFNGDKFVDAEGRNVTNNVESELVVWPVRVYHAPAQWASPDFGICQTSGPYEFEFEASDYNELRRHQNSKW